MDRVGVEYLVTTNTQPPCLGLSVNDGACKTSAKDTIKGGRLTYDMSGESESTLTGTLSFGVTTLICSTSEHV